MLDPNDADDRTRQRDYAALMLLSLAAVAGVVLWAHDAKQDVEKDIAAAAVAAALAAQQAPPLCVMMEDVCIATGSRSVKAVPISAGERP